MLKTNVDFELYDYYYNENNYIIYRILKKKIHLKETYPEIYEFKSEDWRKSIVFRSEITESLPSFVKINESNFNYMTELSFLNYLEDRFGL